MPQDISRREPDLFGLPGLSARGNQANFSERGANLVPKGAWSCDLLTEELAWTDGVFDLFGFARGSLINRQEALSRYGEESRQLLNRLRSEAIASCGVFSMDAQIIHPGGEERWIRLTGATRVANGRPVELYGMKQDITADRVHQASVRRMNDAETRPRLASPTQFVTDFLDCPVGCSPITPLGALLLVNLNACEGINQSLRLGATEGCAEIFGERLISAFPEAAMISMIGNGKFAVLLPPGSSQADLGARAYDRVSGLLGPVYWRGEMIALNSSAGMAFADPRGASDPDAMFAVANRALRDAKYDGNDRLRFAMAAVPFESCAV